MSKDSSGLIQSLGVLATATVTGALTFVAWRNGLWPLAFLALIAHGNVCSLFISAVHELSHGTVFKSEWLNGLFSHVFGFLNWTPVDAFWEQHRGHHGHTLQANDTELDGTCRALWAGTFIWSAVFNVPRFIGGIISNWNGWIPITHLWLALFFILKGWWELVLIVNLAPFWFGWLELLLNYPQHAGLPLDATDTTKTTRSLKLPRWLSFLHWHMEYHLEHHIWPNVPCYHLPEFRKVDHSNLSPVLPRQETLLEAWIFILLNRTPGRCGHGDNPLIKLVRRFQSRKQTTISNTMKTNLILAFAFLSIIAKAETVTIMWDASTSPGVNSYRVFSSTNSGLTWKSEVVVPGLSASVNLATNVTTIGVAAMVGTSESGAAILDLLPMVKNVRASGYVITWDANPLPATGYAVMTSTNLLNWNTVSTIAGRTNTMITLSPATFPPSVVAVAVRATTTNSISLRATADVLKPVTGLRIIEVN